MMPAKRLMIWKRLALLTAGNCCYRQPSSSTLHTSHLCTYHQGVPRVRFGPSPTGFVHLGGLRTALYNYLFAKSQNGHFILRIEDTDQTRLVPGAKENIEQMLEWVGLSPDEGPSRRVSNDLGPYTQSERLSLYQDHIQTLLENGNAYRCFCTPQRIALLRKEAARSGETPKYDNRCRHLTQQQVHDKHHKGMPYVVRFKWDSSDDGFDDMVFGYKDSDTATVEGDPILLKSDGWPTYHLANVVDDHLMKITQVLRGMEWLSSTTKHVGIYKAFGWSPPKFAHLPLLMNKDGTKLSKRQGDLFVENIKNAGYLPEAVLNLLTYCGGGFPRGKEIKTIKQLISEFDLSEVSRHSAVIDMDLLEQVNRGHITRLLECEDGKTRLIRDLREDIMSILADRSEGTLRELDDEYLLRILETNKHRIGRVRDLIGDEFEFLWRQPSLTQQHLSAISPQAGDILSSVYQTINLIPSDIFAKDLLSKELKTCHKKLTSPMKFGIFMKLLRMAVSGLEQGPGVAEMMELLGKEETCQRLHQCHEQCAL